MEQLRCGKTSGRLLYFFGDHMQELIKVFDSAKILKDALETTQHQPGSELAIEQLMILNKSKWTIDDMVDLIHLNKHLPEYEQYFSLV